MTYQEALRFLYSRPSFEIAGRFTAPRDLARVAALLLHLGNPQRQYQNVIVAGTKGKGSTSSMLASCLQAGGYRVGLYTQPHLHSYRERIRVAGEPISEAETASLVAELAPSVEALDGQPELGRLSTYEVGTALALSHFARQRVAVAVLEVGLGGRLDAVNVVDRGLEIITSISRDHTDVLGPRLADIAREKAAVIQPGTVAVTAGQEAEAAAVIRARVEETGARWLDAKRVCRVEPVESTRLVAGSPLPDRIGQSFDLSLEGVEDLLPDGAGPWRLWLPLLGGHQRENAALAVLGALCARRQGLVVEREALVAGLARVRWPGRFEMARQSPLTVVDGAHNDDSLRRLLQAVDAHVVRRRTILVLGVSRDKDLEAMARVLAGRVDLVVTAAAHHPRAASPEQVGSVLARHQVAWRSGGSLPDALSLASGLAGEADLVLVTGSLFIVAEAREYLGLAEATDPAP